MESSSSYRTRRQSQMTNVSQSAAMNPMLPVGGGKSMFGRRVRNALKRMSTFGKAGADGSKPERSIFRRGSIAKTEEDANVKKTYTNEDRRRSIQAAQFLKRNDDAKRRSSLTAPDGLIHKKVDDHFENTSRPFKKEEIDVIRKACSVPPKQRDDEIVQHLAYVLNFITFFKQLPQQAVFDLCRDINYIAVKGNPIELFKQGSLGNSVYLILSGKCTVYRAAANQPYDESWKPFGNAHVDASDIEHHYGSKQVTLESPANFGELAVMKSDRQATTCIAEVDTELLLIEKKSYDQVIMKLNSVVCQPDQCRNILDIPPEKRTNVHINLLSDMLRRHRFFQQLPTKKSHVYRELCRHVTLLRVPPNRIVCYQGQPGMQFLVLLAGEIKLYQFDEQMHEDICEQVEKAIKKQQELSSNGSEETSTTSADSGSMQHQPGGEKSSGNNSGSNGSSADPLRKLDESEAKQKAIDEKLNGSNETTAAVVTSDAASTTTTAAAATLSSSSSAVEAHAQLAAAAGTSLVVSGHQGATTTAINNDSNNGASSSSSSCKDDTLTSVDTPVDNPLETAEKGMFGHLVNTLNAGDSFGERALMRNEPRHFTAITKQPTEIMVIEKKVFDSMVAACGQTMFAADALVAMLKVIPSRRDDATVDRLCQLTKDNKFLSGLPRSIHMELCKAMTYQKFNKDSVVFYQGDVGDSFYIIITGTLSVHVKPQDQNDRSSDRSSSSSNRRKSSMASVVVAAVEEARNRQSLTDPTAVFGPSVALVKSGDSFGELSLIQGAPRAATCITREVCEFLVISKNSYDYVLADLHARELTEKISALRHLPPLQDWSESKLLKISYTFVKKSYPRGRVIVQEGDAARNLYIIVSGECRVLKRSKQRSKQDRLIGGTRRVLSEKTKVSRHGGGRNSSTNDNSSNGNNNVAGMKHRSDKERMPQNFELAVMGPGDFFGEYAYMQQCKQPITIIASSMTEVFTITMSEFMKYLAEEHAQALKDFSTEKMTWLIGRATSVSDSLMDARKLVQSGSLPGLVSAVLSKHGVNYNAIEGLEPEESYQISSTKDRYNPLKYGKSSSSASPRYNGYHLHQQHQQHASAKSASPPGKATAMVDAASRYMDIVIERPAGSAPSAAELSHWGDRSPSTIHGAGSASSSLVSPSRSFFSSPRSRDAFGLAQRMETVVDGGSAMKSGSHHHHRARAQHLSGLNEDFASSLALTSRVWKSPRVGGNGNGEGDDGAVGSPRVDGSRQAKAALLPVIPLSNSKSFTKASRPMKGFTTNIGKPLVVNSEFMHIRDARTNTSMSRSFV